MLRLTLMTLITFFAMLTWQMPAYAEQESIKKGYIVIDMTVKDQNKLKQYGQVAKKLIAKNGGKFIANSKVEVLHGTSDFKVKAIVEFPSVKSAKAWYNSPEYQKVIPLRSTAIDAQFHLIY